MRLLNRHCNQCSRAQEVVPLAPTPIEVEAYDSDHEVSDQVTTVPRRVTRMRTTSEWYSNPVLKVMLLDNNEPTSYGEAMVGPYSDKWLEAMKSEIGSIYQNKAWTLVDLPDDRQAIEINGSLRRRRAWTVMSPSMKLDLWRRVFHKFKELTTMRFSHPQRCLSPSESCQHQLHL